MTSESPAGVTPFRYWAFISYSQRDAEWARRLHRFLETYRIPSTLVGRQINDKVVPRRLAPVFLDREELPGSPDLGATLRESLAASASLIVICSPNSAASSWVNEEVRSYKAAGKASRCFSLIIAGPPIEPGQPERMAEVFPKALRFEVTPDGAISDRPIEPLAADAREGRDGWNDACLKLVAGILGVGFDDLRRREASRRRRQRMTRGLTGAAAVALVGIGYVGLADADLPVPGGTAIRRYLDSQGVTAFRPVLGEREMARLAKSIRAAQRKRLLADVASGTIQKDRPMSAWTIGEVVGAGFRDRDASPKELESLLRLMELLYEPPEAGKPEGHRLTETPDDIGNPGRAEPVLWAIMALSAILARPDAVSAEERKAFERYLAISQRMAEAFYPIPGAGWNTAARQIDPRRHFIYSSGVALHMLLELRALKLGWHGSHEQLDRMVSDTATWLHRAFVHDGGRPGWRKSLDDDRPPDSGITLLVHSALGRACADVGIAPPADIRQAAIEMLTDLRHRRYKSSDPDIRYDVRITDTRGDTRTQVTVTRMIWYPWAIEALMSWRRCAQRQQLPADTVRALDRSLSHLLKDVGPEMLQDVLRPERPLWINSETYYGVGSAP